MHLECTGAAAVAAGEGIVRRGAARDTRRHFPVVRAPLHRSSTGWTAFRVLFPLVFRLFLPKCVLFVDLVSTQVLARCQRLSVARDAIDSRTGAFNATFSVLYLDNEIPFSLLEVYEPATDPNVISTRRANGSRGLYVKHVDLPFGSLVHIPTVVVEAFVWNETSQEPVFETPETRQTNRGSGSNSHERKQLPPYNALVLNGCLDVLGELPVRELIFATRSRAPDADLLAFLEKRARALGVSWSPGELETNDWASCPKV
jgi:hypothetical protein